MRIEIAKSDFLHVDAKKRAHFNYRLRFWDEKNNRIEGKKVQVFEKNPEKNTERKISDDDTNIDGEVEIRVVFDLVNETQKLILAVIEGQKREVVLPIDMSRQEIRTQVDQILKQIEDEDIRIAGEKAMRERVILDEKHRAEAQINAERLKLCQEQGQFQPKIGVGRLYIGTGWVVINRSGAIVSPIFNAIQPFDEETKQTTAQEKENEWFVRINQRGEIIDEALGLPLNQLPNSKNINAASFEVPTRVTDSKEKLTFRAWKKDFDDYVKKCEELSRKEKDRNRKNLSHPKEEGIDWIGKKEQARREKIVSLEKLRKEQVQYEREALYRFLKERGIPLDELKEADSYRRITTRNYYDYSNPSDEVPRIFSLGTKPSNEQTSSEQSTAESDVSRRSSIHQLLHENGVGYLQECPVVPDLTPELSEAIKKYLEKAFQDKVARTLAEEDLCVNAEIRKHTGENGLAIPVTRPATEVYLTSICDFILKYPRFTARVFLDKKLQLRLNPSVINSNHLQENPLQLTRDEATKEHEVQIDIDDGCGVTKCVQRLTIVPGTRTVIWKKNEVGGETKVAERTARQKVNEPQITEGAHRINFRGISLVVPPSLAVNPQIKKSE